MNSWVKPLHYYILIGGMVLASLAWPAMAIADDGQKHVAAAQQYMESGKVKAAMIELKNALQKNPDNAGARIMLGGIYLELNNGPSAEKEIGRARELGLNRKDWVVPLGKAFLAQGKAEKALEHAKVDDADGQSLQADIHAVRGQARLSLGELDKAREEINQALKLSPEGVDGLLAAVSLAVSEKAFDKAGQHVNQALAVNPKSADAWVFKGELHRLDGKLDQALEAYSRALALQPHNVRALLGTASIDVGRGDPEAASAAIEALAQWAPDMLMLHYLKAVVAFQKREMDKAGNILGQILQAAPGHLASHLLLGSIKYTQGQFESAETHLSKYLKHVPNHLPAAKLLAATRLKRKDSAGAIDVLEPMMESAAKDPQFLAMLGSAYLEKKDYVRGSEMLERAAAISPAAAAIRTQLGLSHFAQGKTELAVSELESAVELDSDLAQADAMLVLVHLQSKNFDKALMAAEALAKKLPDNPVPVNLIAAAQLGKGEREAARKTYQRALEIEPKFVVANINLARMAEEEKDFAAARGQYEKVLQQAPTNMAALLSLGRLAEVEGAPEEAVEWVKKARDANPKATEPRMLLSRYYLTQGNHLKALEEARAMAEVDPKNPSVLHMYGSTLLAADKAASAVNEYKKLVELQPNSAESHYALAQAYARQEDYAGARVSLLQALELQKDNLPILVALADLELRDGRLDEALKQARHVQSVYPEKSEGHIAEGQVHLKSEDFDAASKAFKRAYVINPNGQLAMMQYRTLHRIGKADEGETVLRDWLERQPDDLGVRFVLAARYQTQGKPSEAISEYERIMEKQSDNMEVLNNLAWLYHEQGDARGLEYAEKAYKLSDNRPEVADTLGWILVNQGQVKRGLALLQDAAVKAPHIPDVRYHLAVALHKSGDKDEARKELERLLSSGHDFSDKGNAKSLLESLQ